MSEYDNAITGDDIDNALDGSSTPDSNESDIEDVNAGDYDVESDDDTPSDIEDEEDDGIPEDEFQKGVQDYGVKEDDLIIVNQDGSYVVIPLELAEVLMGDPEFINKVDYGFTDIHDFAEYIHPVIQKLQDIIGGNNE